MYRLKDQLSKLPDWLREPTTYVVMAIGLLSLGGMLMFGSGDDEGNHSTMNPNPTVIPNEGPTPCDGYPQATPAKGNESDMDDPFITPNHIPEPVPAPGQSPTKLIHSQQPQTPLATSYTSYSN